LLLAKPLYRLNEVGIRAIYTQVKDRTITNADLLSGSPGTLVKRAGTGQEYWYRSYSPAPRKRSEQFVGTVSNAAAHEAMRARIANSEWTAKQVAALSKLGYQVADKTVASVLVELHNRKVLQAGLVAVGELAYMSWLNEYGVIATAAKTSEEVALGRLQTLKLATTISFLSTLQATQLPFAEITSALSKKRPTAVKLAGAGGLRVSLFAPGPIMGEIVPIPELEWHAQTVPFYGYLLEGGRAAAILAGGHCIPIMLPEVARMVWHKLYSSTRRG
jgi:hypothetical protein